MKYEIEEIDNFFVNNFISINEVEDMVNESIYGLFWDII